MTQDRSFRVKNGPNLRNLAENSLIREGTVRLYLEHQEGGKSKKTFEIEAKISGLLADAVRMGPNAEKENYTFYICGVLSSWPRELNEYLGYAHNSRRIVFFGRYNCEHRKGLLQLIVSDHPDKDFNIFEMLKLIGNLSAMFSKQ